MLKLTGIIPALLTPFDENDQVNIRVLRDLVEYLLSKGASGFYVCGGTGEGLFMTEEERRLTAETVVDQVKGRAPVVVHVGALSTRPACHLAAHAEEIRADGVSAIPPIYIKADLENVKRHYAAIASASSLPFYVYNIPGMTGVMVGASMMETLMDEIPRIRGMKYTAYDFFEMRKIAELDGGRLNVVSGPDEMMIAAQVMGADGAIGTTYNLLPRLFVDAYEALHAGDVPKAQEFQAAANRVISVFLEFKTISVIKEMARLIGYDCGAGRPPNRPLSDEEKGRLRESLEEVDYFRLAER